MHHVSPQCRERGVELHWDNGEGAEAPKIKPSNVILVQEVSVISIPWG